MNIQNSNECNQLSNTLNTVLTSKELIRQSQRMKGQNKYELLSDLEIVEKYNRAIRWSVEYFRKKNGLRYKEYLRMISDNEMMNYLQDIQKQSELYVTNELIKIESQKSEVYSLNYSKQHLNQ